MKFKVKTSCEVARRWREAGEIIEMSAEQAEHLAPPFGNVLEPVADMAPAAPSLPEAAPSESTSKGAAKPTIGRPASDG